MRQELNEEEFATRVRRILDDGCATMEARTTDRLRQARRQALARHGEFVVAGNGLAALTLGLYGSLHRHYRGALAVLALLVGAFAVHLWQETREAEALADIDIALLSDEVSPGAYLDQGFMAWLDHLSHNNEDSLRD